MESARCLLRQEEVEVLSGRADVSVVTLSHQKASMSYPVLSFSKGTKCNTLRNSGYVFCVLNSCRGRLVGRCEQI